MPMTLYGSIPSPFVRRIRLFLADEEYQFKTLNVFDDAERAEYAAITPIKKLPVLVDGDMTIFDSHVIYQYLIQKQALPQPPMEEYNLVSVIDAVTDSLVILFISKRSDLDTNSDQLIFKLQRERIPDSLQWLNQQAAQGAFADWHYATMALISLLDWAEFRELYDFADYPALVAARELHSQRDIVKATMPQ
ncbi:glutathione S-transferase family protein [Dasania sp. GY-MA-18]|uniref:Glutathione S-transferase family protein n=1 Tax=Dasania phycosphaerae TaxID=2950436 RepID=A0A9J6RPX2_9GAMM|nr:MULTISPECIES: glutathione S-transferase family protein [Dasania]MCR8923919.1 glutathione S-transferase family protein [Dasania sp. GY-MA-18]MCZ0866353.1 glutathione S-transferase family protein [Dasania phycosphaerae]MCZ0870077.1 glutathione S-transferase family protein [Dasania phycosphaerae]